MTSTLSPTTTTVISSSASDGTLTTSTGNTISYSGGTEIKAHTIKKWFAKKIHYLLENQGTDPITTRITFQLTPNGIEVELVPPVTLQPGDILTLSYSKPSWYINIYITPTSSSSSWRDEYMVIYE